MLHYYREGIRALVLLVALLAIVALQSTSWGDNETKENYKGVVGPKEGSVTFEGSVTKDEETGEIKEIETSRTVTTPRGGEFEKKHYVGHPDTVDQHGHVTFELSKSRTHTNPEGDVNASRSHAIRRLYDTTSTEPYDWQIKTNNRTFNEDDKGALLRYLYSKKQNREETGATPTPELVPGVPPHNIPENPHPTLNRMERNR